MIIKKRPADSYDIYYIYERINEHKDTIIGFVMETKDQGFDIIYNVQRIFLTKEFLEIPFARHKLAEIKEDVLNHFREREPRTMGEVAPVVKFFVVDKL